ncbi:chemotaxis protein CheB [Lyngbya sp. CCAP 1446/10]|nr:chemotaxis protein CheB [Lyngbya sp. CCAP 1446/10]
MQDLLANFSLPIVIVQHMPPVFTKRLTDRLTEKCKIRVEEAVTGGILEAGVVGIAPGDYPMVLEKQGFEVRICTHQEARENSCRQGVDVLFRSTAKIYGAGVLGVVLTGMRQTGCTVVKIFGRLGVRLLFKMRLAALSGGCREVWLILVLPIEWYPYKT